MGESMLGTMGKSGYCSPISQMAIPTGTVHLPSFHAEKLNNSHTDASGYNKCLFGSTLEAALMQKSVNGENKAW
jgi:hypothetical protein